ncbi:MAG: hypothetical protein LUC99_09725 [Clostridiales bacterium]|nr:hypothetical protein [Clostridiales bacterium]
MESAENFKNKYGLGIRKDSLKEESRAFEQEMRRGLAGEASSLLMLPTYLSAEGEIPVNETVIVMDAGGTNFRVATVTLNEAYEPLIENFSKYPMPGTQGELTQEEFFDQIAEYLLPVIDQSDKIGFCFSFPTIIGEDRDGTLVKFNKEVRVKGAEGMKICASISRALKAKGVEKEKHFVLLNDMVAALMSGPCGESDKVYDSYIGFILGTGTNISYIEKCENILKDENAGKQKGQMIVNIESGGYGKVAQGYFDQMLDRESEKPGEQLYEKMISGAYLGRILYLALKQAMEDGLFSEEFSGRFREVNDIPTYQMNEFLTFPYGNGILAGCTAGNEEDCQELYAIVDAVIERAAYLVAMGLGAVLKKIDKGKLPTRPVCIIAEGTTFYKLKLFGSKLDYYVRSYINDELGYYCEFRERDNATLVGTAAAALMNL